MLDKIRKINDYSLSCFDNPLIKVYSYFNDDFSIYKIEKEERSVLRDFVYSCDKCYSLACDNWDWISIFKECEIVK